jgi:hypothetical protein
MLSSSLDIAGRIYPGLDNVAWGLYVRNEPEKADPNSTGGIERVLSLAGKLPGKTATVAATTWIGEYFSFVVVLRVESHRWPYSCARTETRYKAIMVAQVATRKWLAGFFR